MHFRSNYGATTSFGIGRLAFSNNQPSSGVPFSRTVPLSPGTRSLVVAVQANAPFPGLSAAITVQGNQSGIEWTRYVANGSGQTTNTIAAYNFPATILPVVEIVPCYGAMDQTVTVTIATTAAAVTFAIIESAQDVMQGTPEQPVAMIDPYGPYTPVSGTATTVTSTTILAAAPAGFMYDINNAVITAPTTAASAANAFRLQTGGAVWICGGFSGAAGSMYSFTGRLFTTNSIVLNNNTLVTASASLWYRTIPIPRGYQ